MERTLYLNEKKGLVVMRDGPSLWIREKDKAGTRIPARLIDMVFIVGNIKMDAGTLMLFAENSTPVTFMNKQGEAVGVVMPYNHASPDHHQEQKRFMTLETNHEAFKTWIASQRREAQIAVIKKIDWEKAQGFLSKGFREIDYTAVIDLHRSTKNHEWEAVHGIIENLILEMVIQEIVASNLDPHMGMINKNCNFGFALDLYQIISPESDLISIQFFTSCRWHDFVQSSRKNCTLTKDGWKNIVHRFENRKKKISHGLDMVLRGFFDLMRHVTP
ncbi:MAG: CRISPR-associated endonuclease Cas1 [Syntrophorhabdus sp.]|jgi:CRISPR/Cas system-associated endonuclease Cas1|nr:CRISPR-associated endonuclease Cas1 [Syntrophorhabdus sp.]MBP8698991.1 CRISPR-associated endonuclease Cas1 [Syntrophorhabdaceae bacterium]OPX95036.1 MAG: CRISPR-associated endonuclease Cas1 [Syntrophorhabdus sp. PtaB.Bin027]OQB77407.1 MAG: CRISPR-associated endonuclease Cas1 [Deltaproteobacteria bacterium ADurb.Bin135]HOD77578.1 CRISPR-associated endonuclease Cas1 [Syntrophorhabdus sp.]